MDMKIMLKLANVFADELEEELAAMERTEQQDNLCRKCGNAIFEWDSAELVNVLMELSYKCACGNCGKHKFTIDYEKVEVFVK